MGPSQVWHIRRLEGADFVREGDGESAIAGGIQCWVLLTFVIGLALDSIDFCNRISFCNEDYWVL